MWISYGRRDDALAAPLGERLAGAIARAEPWHGPVAIAALFAYPNPLVPVALAALAASLAARIVWRQRATVWTTGSRALGALDAGLALFVLGALIGLSTAHHREAAALRFTGILAAAWTFYLLPDALRSRVALRRGAFLLLALLAAGMLLVLALLRGELPDSAVARALGPLPGLASIFPGISGDTLDVNTRFAVHHYGLAYLLLVAGAFAAAGAALGTSRPGRAVGLLAFVALTWLLLATQARGAILALAVAGCAVSALRTRLAWALLPLAGLGFWVLLARGTISRTIEAEWLNQRLTYWTGTLGLLGDLPFGGAGLGMRTFAEVYAWYHGLPDPYQVSHTHNVYLQAYAEQGLLGVVGLATLVVSGTALGFRAARGMHRDDSWIVGGAAVAVLGTAIYGLTDQVPSTNLGLGLLFALLAVVVAGDRLARVGNPTPDPYPGRKWGWGWGLVAIVLLAAVIGLGPRWASGLLLNLGTSELLAARLDRSGDGGVRAARLRRAEWALAGALSWNPENVVARRNLGWVRLLANDVPGAHALVAASYGFPMTPFERGQVARLAREAGLIELAVELHKQGGDDTRLREVATQMWAARRWGDAALAYAALTELHPDEAEYVSNAAIAVLNGGGDAEQAMTLLREAVARNPGAARSLSRQLVLRGEPCRSDERRGGGRFECAAFWFGLASRIDPTYDRPEVELGAASYYRGRYEDALAHFAEASRRDPRNPSTYIQLGDSYLQLTLLDQAVGAYERAVQARPDRAEARAKLAGAHAQAGRRIDALREYRAAAELAPGNPAIREALDRLEAGR